MNVADDDGWLNDIGVATRVESDRSDRAQGRARRSLPAWALVVLSVLIGWLIGTITAARGDSEPATTPPPTAISESVMPEPDQPATAATVPISEELGSDLVTVVLVQAPLRGVPIPADITVIDDEGSTGISTGRSITGVAQTVAGQADQRILVVDDLVVFMALDSVMSFDPFEKSEPVELATAIYLMPGSNPGRVWAVTSRSQSVLDIDVRSGTVRAEYDLRTIGRPLGTFQGGLVVAPVDRRLGSFAIWNPRQGIERLLSIDEDAVFLDAAGNNLAIRTAQGLASYNVVTGSLSQTRIEISAGEQHRSFVSPDGARLAVVDRGTVAELPSVRIVDLASGEVIDAFETAFEWQLQWTSPTEVLFTDVRTSASGGLTVSVRLRDVTRGQDRSITDLSGPNFWVTVAG